MLHFSPETHLPFHPSHGFSYFRQPSELFPFSPEPLERKRCGTTIKPHPGSSFARYDGAVVGCRNRLMPQIPSALRYFEEDGVFSSKKCTFATASACGGNELSSGCLAVRPSDGPDGWRSRSVRCRNRRSEAWPRCSERVSVRRIRSVHPENGPMEPDGEGGAP